jgi:hypothetical protein
VAELLEDHLVLAGVHIGLGEHPQQALALPRRVVLPAPRVLEVLDAVDAVVEPAIAGFGREFVTVLGEHVVGGDPVRGSREGAVVIEHDGRGGGNVGHAHDCAKARSAGGRG